LKIHTFDNDIKVYDHHLLPAQRERYQKINLHEPEEESVFLDVVGKLAQGAAFINIGAAIGYYAILAKRRRPDLVVHAYEPLRAHRQNLRKNMQLNDLSRDDILICAEGIDRTDGVAAFHSQDFSSRLDRDARKPQGLMKHLVKYVQWFRPDIIKTISLERAIDRCDTQVGLVSMDIQGVSLLKSA